MISSCRLLTVTPRQFEQLQIHRTFRLILFGAQDKRCNKATVLICSACVTVHGWSVGQLPVQSKYRAGLVTDNAGLMPGNTGRITTAAGGQTSSPIRRFLTEVSLSLSYLLNVSVFALPCWKKCPSRVPKCPSSTGKNAPADGTKCPSITQLVQVHFMEKGDLSCNS